MKTIMVRLHNPFERQVFVIVLQAISKKQQKISAFNIINYKYKVQFEVKKNYLKCD